jgi:hypothetical protein
MNTLAAAANRTTRFIGLSLSADHLDDYEARYAPSFPVYVLEAKQMIERLKLYATPQLIVVGPDGVVRRDWSGALNGARKAEVEQFFGVLLPGLTDAG